MLVAGAGIAGNQRREVLRIDAQRGGMGAAIMTGYDHSDVSTSGQG